MLLTSCSLVCKYSLRKKSYLLLKKLTASSCPPTYHVIGCQPHASPAYWIQELSSQAGGDGGNRQQFSEWLSINSAFVYCLKRQRSAQTIDKRCDSGWPMLKRYLLSFPSATVTWVPAVPNNNTLISLCIKYDTSGCTIHRQEGGWKRDAARGWSSIEKYFCLLYAQRQQRLQQMDSIVWKDKIRSDKAHADSYCIFRANSRCFDPSHGWCKWALNHFASLFLSFILQPRCAASAQPIHCPAAVCHSWAQPTTWCGGSACVDMPSRFKIDLCAVVAPGDSDSKRGKFLECS